MIVQRHLVGVAATSARIREIRRGRILYRTWAVIPKNDGKRIVMLDLRHTQPFGELWQAVNRTAIGLRRIVGGLRREAPAGRLSVWASRDTTCKALLRQHKPAPCNLDIIRCAIPPTFDSLES